MEIICLIYSKFSWESQTPFELSIVYIYFRIMNQALLAVLVKLLAPVNTIERGPTLYEGLTLC